MSISSTYLSQTMWDVYALGTEIANGNWSRMASYKSLSGLSFRDLMTRTTAGIMSDPGDPKKQLMNDYYEWKKMQPPQHLPDSVGKTEENLAYLRQHFSGKKLSVFDKIYALDTMREMGMITEDDMLHTIGVKGDICVVNNNKAGLGFCWPIANEGSSARWMNFFMDSSMTDCDTLEELFHKVDCIIKAYARMEQRDPAQEIESVLNVLTSRKAS